MGTGKLVPRFETHGAWTRQTLHKDPQNFREFDVGGGRAHTLQTGSPQGAVSSMRMCYRLNTAIRSRRAPFPLNS